MLRVVSLMRSSTVLLALAAMLTPHPANARRVVDGDLKAAVETWVRYVTADPRQDGSVERLEPLLEEGDVAAYVAHLQGDGFCICAADDRLLPVYLYSPHGSFDPEIPGLHFLVERMARKLRDLDTSPAPSQAVDPYAIRKSEDRQRLWTDLIADRVPRVPEMSQPSSCAPTAPDELVLDLSTHWHQHPPYNADCPVLTPGSDEHVLVGCGATAAAQLMAYWKWPESGTGDGATFYRVKHSDDWVEEDLSSCPQLPFSLSCSFEIDLSDRLRYDATSQKLGMKGYWDGSMFSELFALVDDAAFRLALFDLWDKYPSDDRLVGADFETAMYFDAMGNPNASLLSAHAGIASFMRYGVCGSESTMWDNFAHFSDHFRYAKGAHYHGERSNDVLFDEIDYLRPVMLLGQNDEGGHYWLVYGYRRATEQFKVNLGWRDTSQDTWYTADEDLYPNDQKMGSHLAPSEAVTFVGKIDDPDWFMFPEGSPSHPFESVEDAAANAPEGTVLVFKAGSDNTFDSDKLVFQREMTLKGVDVVIRKE